MVGYIVSFWCGILAQSTAESLSCEEVGRSLNWGSGTEFGKVVMLIFGSSCEGWVGVGVDSR